MTTEFFMPMIPPTTTHQQKQVTVRNGKPVFYEPEDLKAARSKLSAHLGKHVPAEKYTKAIRLMTKWCFPITGSHTNGQYKYTKPDTDNLQKLLKDWRIRYHLHFFNRDQRLSDIVHQLQPRALLRLGCKFQHGC